jgi:eukaryotic-like serine/threonine-protein kinase
VHGSVRPSNLMVVAGILKLADLGLGPLFRVVVSPDAYRAPENHLDVAGDIFSFGATLYHLLTGTPPPASPAPVLPPSAVVAGVPGSFDQLLLRALNTDPAARFRTAKELVQALDAMVTIG